MRILCIRIVLMSLVDVIRGKNERNMKTNE